MSNNVYPPGKRNKAEWVARVIVNGKRTEHVLTGCKNKTEAEIRAMEIEVDRRKTEAIEVATQEEITFQQAAYMYAKWRKLDLDATPFIYGEGQRAEQRRINRLIGVLGVKYVQDIKMANLVDAAEALYPGGKAQTQNRAVLHPASAILHYASKNGYCGWLRVKLFPEPEPLTRTVSAATEAKLMDAALTPMQRLLLVWLFVHGRRISETLRLTWDDIDLNGINGPTYRFYNNKDHGKWKDMPFHPEVFELLVNTVPQDQRQGKLWPWTHRTSVAWWLNPLCKKLGVTFTCHMARHSLGKKLNDAGQSLRTIMDTLGHKTAASSLRYQSTDMDGVRAALVAARIRKAG